MRLNDPLAGLLPFTWRGIPFPCSGFSLELSQDHVEHKYPDKDGAHIEGTGRNPIVFHAKIVFLDGIKLGPGEGSDPPYSVTWQRWLTACADRSSGVLQHPDLGIFNARFKSAKVDWSANRRYGVEVDATWVETVDVANNTDLVLRQVDAGAAPALDQAIIDYQLSQPWKDTTQYERLRAIVILQAALPKFSFEDMTNSIRALFDQVSLFQKRITGKINEVLWRLDNLSEAVQRLKDPQANPIISAIERNREVMHLLQKNVSKFVKAILTWRVPRDMALAQVAATTGASAGDLLAMNPTVASTLPLVTVNTVIRYNQNIFDKTRAA